MWRSYSFSEEYRVVIKLFGFYSILLFDFWNDEKQLTGIQFEVTYHLAWIGVGATYKNDIDMQMKNIAYAMRVMEISKAHDCARVVCTGSVSEYAYVNEPVNG